MPRPAVVALLLAAVPLAAADPPAPSAVGDLVAQLGSDDYARREDAHKRLDALGPAALGGLRAAARSANPEVARRAGELAARIARRLANEKALAPTVVELTADRRPLAAVLADLSKQAGFPVVVGGPNADEVADDPVTVRTGRVAFWAAVLAVCDAADLHIRSVSGYPAPGTTPVAALGGPVAPAVPADAVVLEAAGVAGRRPAAVYGAVCVEAVRLPTADPPADAAASLLLVWPEPKLNWQAATGVRVERAADPDGRPLAAVPGDLAAYARANRSELLVRQRGGGRVVAVDGGPAGPPPSVAGFVPNSRQAVVRLKAGAARADLAGAVLGVVRTGAEPLVELAGLEPGSAAEGTHPVGVEMRAVVAKRAGRWELTADLLYDPSEVQPDGQSPVLGLRVTDADGHPFDLTMLTPGRGVRVGRVGRLSVRVTASLAPPDGRSADPAAVAFWGTYPRAVEVPFALTGVPLVGSGGKFPMTKDE